MSTLPLFEAILLEIHQSMGCQTYQTTKKKKFASGQMSLKACGEMFEEVIDDIFNTLGIDKKTQSDAFGNLMEFANAYKTVELSTWTFAATQRQILWTMLAHFYIPGLARRIAFWSLEQPLDKGMPGGRFWYLPEPCEHDGQSSLSLPVAQVVDWLLDLLGMPLEEFADKQSGMREDGNDSLRRSLYNWRSGGTIRTETINKYFSDETTLTFEGTISLESNAPLCEQFITSLNFVRKREMTADKLRFEIPMTQPGRIEAILSEQADDDERTYFVKCIVERYSTPSLKTIRQRFMTARMIQDGYVRLLAYLCPDVDRLCADYKKNKLLQIVNIYKIVYNLTIDAWKNCKEKGEHVENFWFESHLPEWHKHGLFLSILPSRRATSNLEIAALISRYFSDIGHDSELEDFLEFDMQSTQIIMQRNIERMVANAGEIQSQQQLIDRMRTSSPWRALQNEHRYWVISQVAQQAGLSPHAKEAAITRLRELASTPSESIQVILLELHGYLNCEHKKRPKDTISKVQTLLNEAEISLGYQLWKAPILQYKAKHLLACNDFDKAASLFREALAAAAERNYGTLRGEVARECLAVEVANNKLIPNNHEKYYREMIAGGVMSDCHTIPPIEETARWASDYFWDELYKPYPGVKAEKRRTIALIDKLFKELFPLFEAGDESNMQQWIKANQSLLKSNLPDVEGNSVLMALLKLHSHYLSRMPLMRQITPPHMQSDIAKFELMLAHWRKFFGQLITGSPKQLNIRDIKGQTPLMLVAEKGDTELVTLMLKAGADPDIQSNAGMTALHSAIKSQVIDCIDALIDHPCSLELKTDDGRTPLHTAGWAANAHAITRLLKLAPEMAWQRDHQGQTALELVEYYIDRPDALQLLSAQRAQAGKNCASKKDLETIALLLEEASAPL